MTDHDLTGLRKQLLALGYNILPNRFKVPVLPGWNASGYLTPCAKYPSAEAIVDSWERRFPEATTTGVRIERGLGVVDLDIDDVLSNQLLLEIEQIAPDIFNRAPTRYGGGHHKMALFVRIVGEPFVRLASHKWNGHQVEIFGGAELKGKASRQFGIYGPHSEGTSYTWADGVRPLHDVAPGDLPALTRAQAGQICDAFDQLAAAAGWKREAVPDTDTAGPVYDINEATRFDTDKGGRGIGYAELCDEHAAFGDLRCASSFMVGREGTDTSRCWVFHSPRHDCVAVYVYGDAQTHYPAEMALVDVTELGEKIKDAADAAGLPIPEAAPNWRERHANGSPRASVYNARLAIEHSRIYCSEDVFHMELWMGRGSAASPSEPLLPFLGAITDANVLGLRMYLSDRYGRDFTETHVRDAVMALAHENRFNPVVDMLADAEANWDGTGRLDCMAVEHFNCADTELARQCVRKTMIAAVARARQPGCKFDTIPVLEAPEGWNKSTAWQVLAGEGNFSDERILGKESREVQEQLARVWIHESAELAGLTKAEVEAVKAFASRTEDRARPAYGRFLVVQPRHAINVGTTNGDKYLQSQTGNRRFWPLKVLAPIDIGKLRAARLQLWGEAAHWQSQGESLVLPERLWREAAVEQEERRVSHPWEAKLAAMTTVVSAGPLAGAGYIGNGVVHQVGTEQRVATRVIFEHVLELKTWQMHRGHSNTLAEIMRLLGWEHALVRIDGNPVKGYKRVVS